MTHLRITLITIAFLTPLLTACGGTKLTRAGFLSDYASLKKSTGNRMEYLSGDLPSYRAMVIDPIRFVIDPEDLPLTDKQQLAIVDHFHMKLSEMLDEKQLTVVSQPGDNIARLRLAITDIHKSTWWLNLHPGMKLTGVGLGGASMEGEIVDSITGAQLAAIVQRGKGNQFEIDTFSGTDDIKDVINRWVASAGKRIDEMRQEHAMIESP